MPIGQRVALIGGGHNALITAFYLAKGGFKPLVLERREIVGGGAITEEFHPGFRASTLSHTMARFAPTLPAISSSTNSIARFSAPIRASSPHARRQALLFYNDHAKTAAEIARTPKKTPRSTRNSRRRSNIFSPFLAQLVSITPPAIDTPSPEDFWNLFKAGRSVRSLGKQGIFDLLRWGPMAVADFVAEFFETDLLRAVIAARGIFGTALGPWSAGSTAVLLLRAAADPIPLVLPLSRAVVLARSPLLSPMPPAKPARKFAPMLKFSTFA